jgi:threonine aldolase
MNFASDNWAGATEAVIAAIVRHNAGFAPAYGADPLTAVVVERFREIFEADCSVHFVASGTGANAISLASAARPGGLIFCSPEAHILSDECNAAEFWTGGMKLVPVPSRHGLIETGALSARLARYANDVRAGTPAILSLTQASECGTVYGLEAVRALAGLAHAAGMIVHMDGARFANALAALDVSPAELTWRAGVDILSFGGTKNGCLAAEAVVTFTPEKFPHLEVIRQRAGHTLSKQRFIAAQFEGYFADGGWLENARHANAMAQRLAEGVLARGGRLGWTSEANEVFPILSDESVGRLRAAGAHFHPWSSDAVAAGPGETLVRLVASFATRAEDVEQFVALV